MTEFKFVQWGKGTPVDYQRLNAMMLNEQYLKDVVDSSPRGVLLWKRLTSEVTVDPAGGYDVIPGLSNLTFDVEEERLVSFEFEPGIVQATPNTIAEVRFGILVDDSTLTVKQNGNFYVSDVSGRGGSPSVKYVTTSALSKGTHTVSVIMQANVALTSVIFGRSQSDPLLIVRDEGKFISAAS